MSSAIIKSENSGNEKLLKLLEMKDLDLPQVKEKATAAEQLVCMKGKGK